MAEYKAIHINEAMQVMDIAKDRNQTVDIKAWEAQTGNIIEYKGWYVSSSSWKKGWHRVVNPENKQIRTLPDIFIIEINGLSVYL